MGGYVPEGDGHYDDCGAPYGKSPITPSTFYHQHDRLSAALFAPYALWVAFATLLNSSERILREGSADTGSSNMRTAETVL